MNGIANPSAKLLRRARRARIALLATTAAVAFNFVWTLLGAFLMGGFVVVENWAAWWDEVDEALVVVIGLTLIVAAFYVVRCQRELMRGLTGAGVRTLRPGVTFSTFAWMIPLANLFVPLQAFRQVAAATGPGRARALRSAIDTWWALWICGTIANRVATGVHKVTESPTGWLAGTAFELVAAALLVWGGVLLAAILPRLAAEQAELRMLLDALPARPDSFTTAADLGGYWHRVVARPALTGNSTQSESPASAIA